MNKQVLWQYGLPIGWARKVDGHNRRIKGHIVRSPEYNSWHAMMTRCHIPDRENNEQYYVLGVKVAASWVGDSGFHTFLQDMGRRPEGTTLDRIDPEGDYTPDNCRWATVSVQNANKRKRAS